MSEPDIRLQIKARNARVLRAMQAAGYANAAELARSVAATLGNKPSPTLVGEIINFKRRPVNIRDGGWRPVAMAIATALHREPEELWPEYLKFIEAQKTETHIDIDVEQFQAIADGERSALDRDQVQRALAFLRPRERQVIEMRFGLNGNGEHTYEEVGNALDRPVTRERVRQMEAKALRKLRLPGRLTA